MKKGVDKPFETMVAAARRLVGHFRMSTLATNGLRDKVEEILVQEHHGKGLIKDVCTRWNWQGRIKDARAPGTLVFASHLHPHPEVRVCATNIFTGSDIDILSPP